MFESFPRPRPARFLKHFLALFYALKPLLPRAVQIFARRIRARRRLTRYSHVWPIDPQSAEKPAGWAGWPDNRRFALVLTHDVESALGHDRSLEIMELDRSFGFRSAFYFVAEQYRVSPAVRAALTESGFEVGVHGLHHNSSLYASRDAFQAQAARINACLEQWSACGFRSPSMLHNLDWMHALNIRYDASTFDTDPFEPQPDGMGTIFPFWVSNGRPEAGYVELPYTLPQDFTLFVVLKEQSIDIWKRKLDWVAGQGGMAHVITHPDYMRAEGDSLKNWQYPRRYYREFLEYVWTRYEGQYWNALPKEVAAFWMKRCASERSAQGDAALDPSVRCSRYR